MKLIWSILLAAASLAAQTTGSLSGLVLDPSGSLVPGAAVSLRQGASSRTVKTGTAGHYEFAGLKPGTYTVSAAAAGFARFESQPLTLDAGARLTLDLQLLIAGGSEQVTVSDVAKLDVDPSSNAGALVLSGQDLDALPDDRDDLATDLQALAGPAAGPNGGQIFIDGFTGGRLPPKQSIREIRINQNPFSAQYDKPGQGRIEIFTKPGAEDLHGELVFIFGDDHLNSRNPFVTVKPPYQRRQFEGEVTGPINDKTSYFVDFERRDITDAAYINAVTLTGPLSESIRTPQTGYEMNFKLDRQLSKDHTLALRYGFQRDSHDNQGVGGFSLPGRAYSSNGAEDTFQATETGVWNLHTVNETRFRFRRQNSDQNGGTASPTISVLDSFTAGGSPVGTSFDHQKRYELQNFTSWSHGTQLIRWGGLMRGVELENQAMQNYAGTYTFTSLNNYRLGIPSQFSLTAGNPLASLHQFDFGFFVQDDWRIKQNLTLSGGLRYEVQTHAGDLSAWGPRLGFAWAPKGKDGKVSRNVIRGGFGLFYDRLSESLTLDALRQDGLRQQSFLIPNPGFYPAIPSTASLLGSQQPQTIRQTDPNWQAPMLLQAAIGLERQLDKGITMASNYIHSTGTHALRSRVLPYSQPGSLYFYETSGVYRQDQWITNVNAKVSAKLSLNSFYAYGNARSNTDGAGSFPANPADTSQEFGRAGFDIRHRFNFNGTWSPKWGLRFSPFLTITSGRPFNITTGTDLNGDGIYNDRPAFATDLTRSSVVRTAYGNFDVSPLAGQRVIPRNFADGPGQIAANIRIYKAFNLGHPKPKEDPRQITVSMNARNILNHPNLAQPTGNLSSLLFGQSTSLAAGQGVSGTRRIDLQVKFSF